MELIDVDSDGNKLWLSVKKNKPKRIYLELKGQTGRNPKIATVDGNHLLMHRDYNRDHFYNETQSFGFNYRLLNGTSCTHVHLTTSRGEEFLLPIKDFMLHADFRNYKKVNYELQVFVKLADMQQYKTK